MRSSSKAVSKMNQWKSAIVVLGGIFGAAFLGVTSIEDSKILAANTTQKPPSIREESLAQGIVLGETDVALPGALKSENYTLGQVAVGGDVVIASSDTQDIGPLEIASVRGEAFMNKDKKDVNVLITWKTSKLSTATIKYGKNGTETFKTIEEDGYGLNHSIIVTGLDQASAYIYTISAQDRSGNATSSDSYAIYTGTKSTSLFDLISGAVTDTFGWAMKK